MLEGREGIRGGGGGGGVRKLEGGAGLYGGKFMCGKKIISSK